MLHDITLQINLSPGDIGYAELTVPALVLNHPEINNRLLVVDCCRPQKTMLINPDTKYPLPVFQEKVDRIVEISDQLLRKGLVTEVYYLRPGDNIFNSLSKKYLGGLYNCTHSAGGTANMSYWAGIDLPQTKYVLHYDGDIILHQKKGHFWTKEAISYLENSKDALFAVPRLCPALKHFIPDLPSLHEGRPFESFENYWKNDWFSTRHFLVDKERFNNLLPLVKGRLKLELLLRKYANRAFPFDPEIVLFKALAPLEIKKIILKNTVSWITHPQDKSEMFLEILPKIIDAVTKGNFPEEQRGHENIVLDAWINYFGQRRD